MKSETDFNISFVLVPIEALVHPLCVIPDCGGDSNIYFVVLLKPNWSRFFGERIKYLSTVNVCERTEILGDIKNVQLQVIECLDDCRE
jgi:hypothetical protein